MAVCVCVRVGGVMLPAVSSFCETVSWNEEVYLYAEHCRGFPLFYLHGETAGCSSLPPLLQTLLLQLHTGRFHDDHMVPYFSHGFMQMYSKMYPLCVNL